MDLYAVCTELDPQTSKEGIQRAMEEKATDNDKYHLRKRYQGLYFHNVKTYSKEEFKKAVKQIRSIRFTELDSLLA